MAFNDALTRAGGHRKGHRLQTAYRAVARCVEPIEGQAAGVERVECRGELFGVTKVGHVGGTHAFERDEHDVVGLCGRLLWRDSLHGPQHPLLGAIDATQIVAHLLFGTGRVELAVVQLVFAECVVETLQSVGLQLIGVGVFALLQGCGQLKQTHGGDH